MTPRVRSYCAEAAMLFGTTPDKVIGKGGDRRASSARRYVMHTLRRDGFGIAEIGRMLGGRHHTTVMKAIDQPVPVPARVKIHPQQMWTNLWADPGRSLVSDPAGRA